MINKIHVKHSNLGFTAENIMGPREKKNTNIYPNALLLTKKQKCFLQNHRKSLYTKHLCLQGNLSFLESKLMPKLFCEYYQNRNYGQVFP